MALSTPDSVVRSTIIIFLASFFIGWFEMIQSIVSTISIDDQREIGTAVGTAGGIRQLFACVGGTIFSAVLTNQMKKHIPATVPAALLKAGLPSASIADFISAVSINAGADFSKIPGMTSSIAKIGVRAYQDAAAASYKTVFLVTIYLTVISTILSIWAPNVNHLLTSDVNIQVDREQMMESKGAGSEVKSADEKV
jgi:hypothetical protein